MLAIVVSEADDASAHVGEQLRAVGEWTTARDETRPDAEGGGTVYRCDGAELRFFEPNHLELAGVAAAFDDPDLLVFASRHAGDSGRLLTAHHTGNFGAAELGGKDTSFARACPAAHSHVLGALSDHVPEGYDVGMECTHHGPTDVGVPSMFVEVGSDQPQWDDPEAAEAVARAILDLRSVRPDAPADDGTARHVVGFGGGHYAPRFERIARETDWAVGHVGADWCLDAMAEADDPDEAVLERAFEASAAERAVVAGDHPDLCETITEMGYRVVGERWLRATTGVPLSVVAAVEDRLGPVEDGVVLGGAAADVDTDFAVVDLPTGLCEAAQGVDTDDARAAVTDVAVAVETSEGGTRIGARAAVTDPGDRPAIVDGLAAVLAREREAVTIEDDAVVVHERTFDPGKARTLGVSEGPAFGKLSAGQSVEVGGRTIDPEVVHTERTRRYPY